MLRHISKKKVFCCFIFIVIMIILNPGNHAINGSYEYIKRELILDNLHQEVSMNLTSTSLVDCQYQDVISDETLLSMELIDSDLVVGHKIREGGEYSPAECKPKFSAAIIVPYRDRADQLREFLIYMHTFLRRQHIHYRIFIIEQVDSKLFNRAKLLNIGAVAAMKSGFPCLILHDVDLLPLKPANLYACAKRPRHMSSSIDKTRFVLPYLTLFGGVISIVSSQFKEVNGMSNEYYGWGAEDDDLYTRLEAKNIKLCRFDPDISRYHMALHRSQSGSKDRTLLLSFAKERMEIDGLNNLKYTEVETVLHPLFTHIMVDL